jgi:ethanolamine utilization protein EutQ (cupin superfamily)
MNKTEFKQLIKHEGLALLDAAYSDIKSAFDDEKNDPLNLNDLIDELDSKTHLSIDLARVSSSVIIATSLESLISSIMRSLKLDKEDSDNN